MNAIIEIKSNNKFLIEYNNYISPLEEDFSLIINSQDINQLKGKLIFLLSTLKVSLSELVKDKNILDEIKLELYESLNYIANNDIKIMIIEKKYIKLIFVQNKS